MNRRQMIQGAGAICLAGLIAGCGTEQQQILKDFSYDLGDNTMNFVAEFSSEVNLAVEVSTPIKDWGTLTFIPPDGEKGFRIAADVNLGAFVDPEVLRLERTGRLPNGMPFHRYVETELAHLAFQPKDGVQASVYFGLEPNYQYLGAGAKLKFIDDSFPAGLTISQVILDQNNRQIGVVTLYGPKVEGGQVIEHGGLFVASNISVFQNQPEGLSTLAATSSSGSGINPYPGFDVAGPNAHKYSRQSELHKLFRHFQEKARESGMGY